MNVYVLVLDWYVKIRQMHVDKKCVSHATFENRCSGTFKKKKNDEMLGGKKMRTTPQFPFLVGDLTIR